MNNDDIFDTLLYEFQEINLNNYTDSDVRHLNEWACAAFDTMRRFKCAEYLPKVSLLAELTNKREVTEELKTLLNELNGVYEELDVESRYFVNRAKYLIISSQD
jgi:hypothetical protein